MIRNIVEQCDNIDAEIYQPIYHFPGRFSMIFCLSFADSRLKRSLARLGKQAKALSFFDGVYLLDETHLRPEFRTQFKDKLKYGSRGYGYWIWKPHIIANTLNTMSEGDLLLYLDAGCHFNINGKKRLIEYFELLKKSETGILAFQENMPNANNSKLKHDGRQLPDRPNHHWIKGDVFDYFGVREDLNFTHAQSFIAGIILEPIS